MGIFIFACVLALLGGFIFGGSYFVPKIPLAALLGLSLLIAGCGRGRSAAVTSNTLAQQDAQTAQQIITACMTKGSFITSSGRQAIISCIAPPGHAPQFEACAQQQLSSAHLATKIGREDYLQSVVTCGENNR